MDADLAELDDWLGTLEELQLGLEKTGMLLSSPPLLSSSSGNFTQSFDKSKPVNTRSHVNQSFLCEPPSPQLPCRSFIPHTNNASQAVNKTTLNFDTPYQSSINYSIRNSSSPVHSTNYVHGRNVKFKSPTDNQLFHGAPNNKTKSNIYVSSNNTNSQEATAENDLTSLLRELEVVEEKMKELEQENNPFTRRYSLSSSSNAKRLENCTTSKNATTNQTQHSKQTATESCPLVPTSLDEQKLTVNGYICAEWAAQLNRDDVDNSFVLKGISSSPPPPPEFLGAGDACLSPPPSTETLSLDKERELWPVAKVTDRSFRNPGFETATSFMRNKKPERSQDSNLIRQERPSNLKQLQRQTKPQLPILSYPEKFHSNTHSNQDFPSEIKMRNLVYAPNEYEFSDCVQQSPPHMYRHESFRSNSVTNTLTSSCLVQPGTTNYHLKPDDGLYNERTVNMPSHPILQHPQTHDVSKSPNHMTQILNKNSTANNNASLNILVTNYKDMDEDSNVSGFGSWSPEQNHSGLDFGLKTSSCSIGHGGSDVLSNSISPESSHSEKSISDTTDSVCLSKAINIDYSSTANDASSTSNSNNNSKLVVRVFRPDKTTKAILIEQRMTAGQVASLLIDKNFLQPSTCLSLVEKVPALKIERVFEEHDKLAECILSWPTRSQNMIFFEERSDHFGLIESPSHWLGEEFSKKHMYDSSEAIQNMLFNIDKSGFPEWKDYLYIRKPGDKTWSRRLCVLRSSGLYTSQKNKKSLSPTDLIRILVLDSPLQLYTTTGGWTRMRAPTPHGFAFKPYSAQDPSSMHVFCFCATDENALRHWICRLRIAKYGKQLLVDYRAALDRVHRLITLRNLATHDSSEHVSNRGNCLQRKSSFDILPSSPNSLLVTAESATSLHLFTASPSLLSRRNELRDMNTSIQPAVHQPLQPTFSNPCTQATSPNFVRFQRTNVNNCPNLQNQYKHYN